MKFGNLSKTTKAFMKYQIRDVCEAIELIEQLDEPKEDEMVSILEWVGKRNE